MFRFVIRRLLLMVPVLFGLSVLLFAWVRALPGDRAGPLLGDKATPDAIARVNAQYGFDQPLHVQYLTYIRKMAVGDFGTSPRTGEPVLATFLDRFPATIELAVMALLFAIIVGIPLGYIAAKRAGGFLDVFAVGTSLMGVVVPVFVLAYLLKLVFAVGVPGLDFLAVLPTSGRQEVRIDATHVTGFFVLDGLLTGELDASWNAIKHLILPALALGSIPLAAITRMTRASVLEVLDEDYIRTATAKGLKQIIITWRHVMKNAMMPVLTTIGILTGQLLAGAVLTETVFAFNGIGSYLFQAINTLDYAVLQGFILLIALIYAVVNLVVDLLYGVIDPRMRVR